MCVERVEQGTQDTTLWGSYVQISFRVFAFTLNNTSLVLYSTIFALSMERT